MGLELLYEGDKERIAGYQARIDELLNREGQVIDALLQTDGKDLDMLLIKIRTHMASGHRLLEQIKNDSEKLSGEYLTATAIYQSTVEEILARYDRLMQVTAEASDTFSTAGVTQKAAKHIEDLRSFAAKLKTE